MITTTKNSDYGTLQVKDLDLDVIIIRCTNCDWEEEFSRKGLNSQGKDFVLTDWVQYVDEEGIVKERLCSECFNNGDYATDE
jgi:hypothetical protein